MAQQNSTLSQLQQQFNNLLAGRLSPEEELKSITPVQSNSELENAYMSGITFYENMRVRDEIERQNQLKSTDEMQDSITATMEMLSPDKDKEQYEVLSAYRDRVQGLARKIMYHQVNPTNAINQVREMKMQYRNEIAPVVSAVQEYRTLLNGSIDAASSNPNLLIDKNYFGMSIGEFMKERQNGTEVFMAFDPEKAMTEAQQHANALSARNVINEEQKTKIGDYIRGLQVVGYRNSDIGSLKDMLNMMPAEGKNGESMTVGNLIDSIYDSSGITNGNFSDDQKNRFYNQLVLSFYKGLGLRQDKQYLQDRNWGASGSGGSLTAHNVEQIVEESNNPDLYTIDKNGSVVAVKLGGNTTIQGSIIQQRLSSNTIGENQLKYMLKTIYDALQQHLDANGDENQRATEWLNLSKVDAREKILEDIYLGNEAFAVKLKNLIPFFEGNSKPATVSRLLTAIGLVNRPKSSEADYDEIFGGDRRSGYNLTDILQYDSSQLYKGSENITNAEDKEKYKKQKRDEVFNEWFSDFINSVRRAGVRFAYANNENEGESAMTVYYTKSWKTTSNRYGALGTNLSLDYRNVTRVEDLIGDNEPENKPKEEDNPTQPGQKVDNAFNF